MVKYEIGRLRFDIYYHDDYSETGLCYEFEILDPKGKHEKVICFEDIKPVDIGCVLAELYTDGWQMIQLTEEFTYGDDDKEDIAVWFREAYFHRELPKL